MQDFEKLGVFYLGRREGGGELVLLPSKDLVTHAVVIGMTGSGKTGLGITLLEEAAIDGVPALVVDPKGDLANLLLAFPDLRPSDFSPWVDRDEAARLGLSVEEFAARTADAWAKGLAAWGQDGARIRRLRDAADFAVYTPGSRAGTPLSVLRSFAAPEPTVRDDADLFAARIATTATGLLGLAGIAGDPLRSREHILVATILRDAWSGGRDLDLPSLIAAVQQPPVQRVGVMDLETFFPSKERFALAMTLNNLLAAPGFDAWLEGPALDIGSLLWSATGKPRISILSIAHLGDAERMFFVSLLASAVLGWMRTQSGTSSLRALFYMDEIAGYLPPVANPPSKAPLLTLLKQARAFGLGLVLATQNPVDLDYKALANAGTWFIGRLQTERDKLRVLDGLEGAAAESGGALDRARIGEVLGSLGGRKFLVSDVHADAPLVMETRWALSYLRGPLSRDELKRVAAPPAAVQQAPANPWARLASTPPPNPWASLAKPAAPSTPAKIVRPLLPPDVPQCFVPATVPAPPGASLVYEPSLVGAANVRFTDAKLKLDETRARVLAAPVDDGPVPVQWADATALDVAVAALQKDPQQDARFVDPPAPATRARAYAAWGRDLATHLSASDALTVLRSPSLKTVSRAGESERDFRLRLGQEAREARDAASEKLRQKFAPKLAALDERIRRAAAAVEREQDQARQQKMSAALSLGSTLLGSFLGRKAVSQRTVSSATTTARSFGRASREAHDVERAADTVHALEAQRQQLDDEFKAELAALEARIDPSTEALETIVVKPKKTACQIVLVALGWLPYWVDGAGARVPAFARCPT